MTSAEGEFFYESDQPDSIKVGSKVFHSKQGKFGIVKKQVSPERFVIHWEGEAVKAREQSVDIKYVYPVPLLSPRQPVQAGQRVVIIAGQGVDPAQDKMKKQADTKRRQLEFQVGDKVLLSTQNLKYLAGDAKKLWP